MLCNDVPLPGEDEEAMLSEAFLCQNQTVD
jgi:hypothetical protein